VCPVVVEGTARQYSDAVHTRVVMPGAFVGRVCVNGACERPVYLFDIHDVSRDPRERSLKSPLRDRNDYSFGPFCVTCRPGKICIRNFREVPLQGLLTPGRKLKSLFPPRLTLQTFRAFPFMVDS